MSKKFLAEILLTNNNILESSWLDFIFSINKLNGIFKKWNLYIVVNLNEVHFYIESKRQLPPIINSSGDFLLKPINTILKPKYIPGFFYYITNQDKNILDVFDKYEAKHKQKLKFIKISFIPYCSHNYLTSTNLFFTTGKINLFSENSKIDSFSEKTLLKRKALFCIPHSFISIDFSKHNRFFYKLDAEKYLNIQKSLHLLKSDSENALLKMDTFPYLTNNYYLHTSSYDFDKHSIVIGSSGTGKSKFLCSIIKNIIQNNSTSLKYKIIVIDPHADMYKDIGGIDNTNVIDFKTVENSINLFSNSEENETASTELILSLFKTLIADQYNSKLERMLRHSIYLLLTHKLLNFTNLRKLLLDSSFRNELVNNTKKQISSSTIDFFLSDFNELKSKSYLESIAPIISFIDEIQLLPAFNKPSENIDLKTTINNYDLNIFSLDQTTLGEKVTQTISGFIMQQLLQLVQSHSFNEHIIFVVDEVSVVENPILKRFLSEARKYNLSLILAQQYFSQISEDLRKSIFANIINYYVFRVSKSDALLLESNMQMEVAVKNSYKVKLKLLTELANRECIIRISNNGMVLPALKGRTLDFESIPFKNKNQIINKNLITKDFDKNQKKSTNFKFSLGETINLKDLMASQSSGRKKVSNNNG